MIDRFTLRKEVGYHIRHEKKDGRLDDRWYVYYDDKLIDGYRAKSRSKFEMQYLLDHVNEELRVAESVGFCNGRIDCE